MKSDSKFLIALILLTIFLSQGCRTGTSLSGPCMGLRPVTHNITTNTQPTWSPAGKSIAFISTSTNWNEVWTISQWGCDKSQITSHSSYTRNPTWSPDGSTIAYELDGSIYTISYEGGTPTVLIPGPECYYPAWSPDGEKIAYEFYGQIFVYFIEGDSNKFITEGYQPCWSPDSKELAFVSTLENIFGIWTIGIDGTGLTQVITSYGYLGTPSWSPDGSKIAFSSLQSGNEDIWVVSVTKGEPAQLTTFPGYDSYPRWSPEGKKIAFVSTRKACESDTVNEFWAVEVKPELIKFVEPPYPDTLQQAEIEGTVLIGAVILKDGSVGPVEVLKSRHPIADSAAMGALKLSIFTPAKQGGEPVLVKVAVPVRFSLGNHKVYANTEGLKSLTLDEETYNCDIWVMRAP